MVWQGVASVRNPICKEFPTSAFPHTTAEPSDGPEPLSRPPERFEPSGRFEHSRTGALLGAVLHERAAVGCLFALLSRCQADDDSCGREGALWALAAIGHLFGGRALQLHHAPAESAHHPPYNEIVATCATRAPSPQPRPRAQP